MKLLLPLGLLGLISIIILIIIYIIKPNYQQKIISSTYIWKLSLNLRKKRLPISKFRNILLIVCQVLALTAGAFILAQPIFQKLSTKYDTEAVIIIDSSASMFASTRDNTRFERAVKGAIETSNEFIFGGGRVSVIVSDTDPHFIANRAGLALQTRLEDDLNRLIDKSQKTNCSYASTDLNSAISLCEDIVIKNPNAEIIVFTDRDYDVVPEGIKIVNVSESSESNIAILDAYTIFEEGYYTICVKVANYGNSAREVPIRATINYANGKNEVVKYYTEVNLRDNGEKLVLFRNVLISSTDEELRSNEVFIQPIAQSIGNQYPGYNLTCVHTYSDISISLELTDSLESDNYYAIYGGVKPTLKVQYASAKRKAFITGALGVMRDHLSESFNVDIKEVLLTEEMPVFEGYDFYIFEEYVPDETRMPVDGVVWLINPSMAVPGITIRGRLSYPSRMYFVENESHSLTENFDVSKVFATACTTLSNYDNSLYKTIWSIENNPVMLIRESEKTRMIITLFDIEYSNIGLRKEFPIIFSNIFKNYMPAMISGNAFEVGSTITVKTRGGEVIVSSDSGNSEMTIANSPSTITFDIPDTYRFTQTDYFGNKLPDEYVFVKIPSSESDIIGMGHGLKEIARDVSNDDINDLLVYFATAMLVFLLAEWLLQSQESV